MQKILQVSEAFGGGIFHSVTRLCKSLEKDFSFTFLLSIRNEAPKDFKEHFPPNSNFIEWSASKSINLIKDIKAIIQLIRVVKREKPDIIHAHSSKAGALVRIAYPFIKLPILYSPRGYAFLRKDFSIVKRFVFFTIEFILGRIPSVTVACSLGELVESFKVAKRSVVIPNMIDADDFKDCELNKIKNERPTMVMVGRLCKQKNPEMFFNIARHSKMQNYKFVWIGDVGHGEKYSRKNIPPNVEITGWLPRKNALQRVFQSDLFIQTSLWEGLPIALLEAMYLSKPILAKPCVGNTEMIIDGFNGYICNTEDDFIQKILENIDNKDAIKQLGVNGNRLVSQYDANVIKPRWKSIYTCFNRYLKFGNF